MAYLGAEFTIFGAFGGGSLYPKSSHYNKEDTSLGGLGPNPKPHLWQNHICGLLEKK